MMRMFEVYATDYFVSTRVFKKIADAETWLESR
jgi:hypothetical protein